MDQEIEVTTHHFKTHFSAITRDLETGKYNRVLVKRNKQPVCIVLRPDAVPGEQCRLGLMQGLMKFDKAEWDSLDDDIARDFNGDA